MDRRCSYASAGADPPVGTTPAETRLRILATTDLHMQIVGHDYVSDRSVGHHGLAGIATLIRTARQEAAAQGAACVLLDNGDLLQGNAMGDQLAQMAVSPAHPVIACLNHLRYDAIGLGNHDLDHGLPYLRAVAGALDMPLVSTNLHLTEPGPLRHWAIATCPLPMAALPTAATLQIGLLSVLPTKTKIWNRDVLEGQAQITCALESLRSAVPKLRAAGADLIVLLAHMGIAHKDEAKVEEDICALAQVDGIDAVITGHTHRRFPGPDHSEGSGVDAQAGTLSRKPAAMPGFGGSDLAVLDLALNRNAQGRWSVLSHESRLRCNTVNTLADPVVLSAARPNHTAIRAQLEEVVGHTDTALHNFFALAMPTAIDALTARAQAKVIREGVAGTPDGDLPILVATAAHTAGGRAGPGHFLHIPPGPVQRRHIAGLVPYRNEVWALRVTGADLRQWLETAAEVFAPLGTVAGPLIDPHRPPYHFDTIHGVTYEINLRRPQGDRITALSWQGVPVTAKQKYLLATNQFRAAGGGGFDCAPKATVVLRNPMPLSEALITTLADPSAVLWPDAPPWRFSAVEAQAILHTTPDALPFIKEIAHLSPNPGGTTPLGFAEIRLHL
ncbi:5'-nucleotidase C-terminal domain-containing protein [Sulfitobacter dubius]|nr:5'-nucleotidase C-terminal domain-containing protein [Sulfitobacter dubius]